MLGMARSGTTAFTHVLSQHPDIFLFTDTYNLENTLIFHKKVDRMKAVVKRHPKHRILMKRPWAERMPDFFKEHTPNARFIFVVRNRESICESWGRTHWVANFLRHGSLEEKKRYYDDHIKHMHTFAKKLGAGRVWQTPYERFASQPLTVMRRITGWLGLDKYKYDVGDIRPGGNWSFMARRETKKLPPNYVRRGKSHKRRAP